MTLRLQIIIAVMIVAATIALVNLIRKGKIELRYALPWLFMAVVLFIMDVLPGIPEYLADAMGIALPVNMLFFLGFVFTMCILFMQSVSLSKNQKRVKQLAQEIALLKERMDAGEGKSDEVA